MTVSLAMMALNPDTKPRHLVFSKMERLITHMNDQKIGIPLKTKKNFLTSVPRSFSGNDLVTWLVDRRCDGDITEALHLASFLCMYGYIYPVDLKTVMVKDDKSILYRFQSPFFWPSKNLKLTNEQFIIYLLKRSKRNKQKHALEEHEQNAFTKLQKVFSDKMGFLNGQAEEQVRQVKLLKRDDKVLHDSQERAFWRVHRPPLLAETTGDPKQTLSFSQQSSTLGVAWSPIMGGLSCVAGKPEDPGEGAKATEEASSKSADSQPLLSQRPSLQVYCGEPRKKLSSGSLSPETANQDNPPGGSSSSRGDGEKSSGKDKVTVKENAVSGNAAVNSAGQKKAGPDGTQLSDKSPAESSVEAEKQLVAQATGSSVPCIIRELSDVPESPTPLSPTGQSPWYLSTKVVKRPRSLDSAENHRKMHLTRPLSYSPGNLKTKHPRSLHSIMETPLSATTGKRERPKSSDMSAMFEAKGFDINTQKLRRILTQKSPTKSKNKTDFSGLISRNLDSALSQPSQVKCIEEGPSRCFQPSQMDARKHKNRDFKLKEVQYFRRALGRPRLKFSKSIENFLLRNEMYNEYDPFLNPLAAQPTNPWISDDEAMWDVNRNLVEVPTEIRIKKWSLSFEELLRDDTGLNEFEQFLKKEYSQENIRFYKACKELMVCPQSKIVSWKASIESEFLTPGAPCEVNIDSKTMEHVMEKMKSERPVDRYIFQPAVDHIYTLMKKDSYTRYLRSEQYKSLLLTAQAQFSKKRFFNFGSNKKRTPSPQPRRRGSASSDLALTAENEIGGASYHSYSTGNLRELDEKPKKNMRDSNVGSDSSIYVGPSNSPSVRRRTEDPGKIGNGKESRRRSNLDVPRQSGYGATTTGGTTASGDPRKSESLSPCLAISVPGKTNIVTPWEGKS